MFMCYVGLFVYFLERDFVFNFGRECKCTTAKEHGDRHIERAIVPGNENSIELSFPGVKRPGSERARERIGQEARRPGSESSRERIGQDPIGRFAPGSELARERKGSVTCYA